MPLGPRFDAAFFARPCLEVAPDLVGATLVHRLADGVRLVGRIVEVEAYLGDGSDPASHSHRGKTLRNSVMFGPPGHLYAYRSYGIHLCANVVCEPRGHSAGVLFRALEPLEGAVRMRRLRGLPPDAPARAIASGPGRLTQALAISLEHNGESLLRGDLKLRQAASDDPRPEVGTSPRIGIRRGTGSLYRFYARGNACLSRREQ